MLESKGKYKIVLWAAFWLLVMALACEGAIRAGLPFKIESMKPYMLLRDTDDWTECAFVFEKIKRAQQAGQDEIFVMLGGSSCREAISSDEDMARMLSEKSGKKVSFFSICTSDQTPHDAAKILAGMDVPGLTVLLTRTPMNFYLGVDRVHGKDFFFLKTSPEIRDLLEKHGIEPSFVQRFALSRTMLKFGQVLNRHLRRFIKRGELKKISHKRHYYTGKPFGDDRALKKYEPELNRRLKSYDRKHKLGFDLTRLTMETALKRGQSAHFLWIPPNPKMNRNYLQREAHFYPILDEMARDLKVDIIDMRESSDWTHTEYHDYFHLLKPGQKRFMDVFVDRLVKLIEKG